MTLLRPLNEEYESRVRASFAAQRAMRLFGARLERIEPGAVSIRLVFGEDLTQHTGFLHAGIVAAIADTACGYAALTLMPADSEVLTVEFKVNLLRPASGDEFLAEARVVKPGKTLTVTSCDVFALAKGKESKLVATMLATMIRQPLTESVEGKD